MRARVLISGGGTGGHVYPALSIIQSLTERQVAEPAQALPPSSLSDVPGCEKIPLPEADVIYLGSSRGMERTLVPRSGIPCFFIPMAPPLSIRGVMLTPLAILRSVLLLARIRPRVIVATGGYVSTAATVAGWVLRIPVVLFSPDIYAGKAVRRLAPLARRVAVTAPEGTVGLPADKIVVTGYPLRASFSSPSGTRARKRFGIYETDTVLVVFGGSQGARRINEALARALPAILGRHHVIHVAGEKRVREVERATAHLSSEQRNRYHLVPYLHDVEMADALAAANLALCRSGASVLGELPATGTPAVLVPLPDPAVHQRENAEYLQSHGAAVVLADADMDKKLQRLLIQLLDDPIRLREMAEAAGRIAQRHAAAALSGIAEEYMS